MEYNSKEQQEYYYKKYQKKYREDNKDYLKESRKKYYKKNKEKLDKNYKKYFQKNKERIYKIHKKWIAKNREKSKLYTKKYKDKIMKKDPIGYKKKMKKYKKNWIKKHRKNPSYIYDLIKTRCKRFRKQKLNMTKEEFIKWYNNQKKICFYCGIKEENLPKSNYNKGGYRLEIDKKENEKEYCIKNIVLACCRCNHIKSDYFTAKEMLKIGKIIKRKNIKNL